VYRHQDRLRAIGTIRISGKNRSGCPWMPAGKQWVSAEPGRDCPDLARNTICFKRPSILCGEPQLPQQHQRRTIPTAMDGRDLVRSSSLRMGASHHLLHESCERIKKVKLFNGLGT